jgi:hypothetical protein
MIGLKKIWVKSLIIEPLLGKNKVQTNNMKDEQDQVEEYECV